MLYYLIRLGFLWKPPNILGAFRSFFCNNSCKNCETLHQEVQKDNHICLPIHLAVVVNTLQFPWVRVVEQMAKIKMNDQTGEHDFPKHCSLMEVHRGCQENPMVKQA